MKSLSLKETIEKMISFLHLIIAIIYQQSNFKKTFSKEAGRKSILSAPFAMYECNSMQGK